MFPLSAFRAATCVYIYIFFFFSSRYVPPVPSGWNSPSVFFLLLLLPLLLLLRIHFTTPARFAPLRHSPQSPLVPNKLGCYLYMTGNWSYRSETLLENLSGEIHCSGRDRESGYRSFRRTSFSYITYVTVLSLWTSFPPGDIVLAVESWKTRRGNAPTGPSTLLSFHLTERRARPSQAGCKSEDGLTFSMFSQVLVRAPRPRVIIVLSSLSSVSGFCAWLFEGIVILRSADVIIHSR